MEIVKEFFFLNNFLVHQKNDILLIKNMGGKVALSDKFILTKEEIFTINNGVVKPVGWHTLKFTPSVIKSSPEIFNFINSSSIEKIKEFFKGEDFVKILVIPGLPLTDKLRSESIKIMKGKGIDYIIKFSTIISGLIERINPRQVYLSPNSELLRILKIYKFFPSTQPSLPFRKNEDKS